MLDHQTRAAAKQPQCCHNKSSQCRMWEATSMALCNTRMTFTALSSTR
jgi:hypothetical protein